MSDYDPYENFPQNRPMPHPGTSSNDEYVQLPEAAMQIDKMGYQHLPEIECPHCETATIYTDDGVDEEGDPRGAIYCVQCNRQFEQAFEVKIVTQEEASEHEYPDGLEADDEWESNVCDHCHGTGQLDLDECPACDGMGYKWWL